MAISPRWIAAVVLALVFPQIFCQDQDPPKEDDFTPSVSGQCSGGRMVVRVSMDQPWDGVVHVVGARRAPCLAYSEGRRDVQLTVNLLATAGDADFCGVQIPKGSEEQTVYIAVRKHRALELLDDKLYHLTCGLTGFRNARNEMSHVRLEMLDDSGKRKQELVYGREYELVASLTKPDSFHTMKMKSCILFAPNSTEVLLTDVNGCPKADFLQPFSYAEDRQSARAKITKMFRFPDSEQFHIQCDVALCQGTCKSISCEEEQLQQQQQGTTDEESHHLLASTTGYVLEPGLLLAGAAECTEWRFPWLVGLCICLAILLLVMLIVNIFLCSSLTCTCTKTEVVEKEPSEVEDYDPYKVGWVPYYGSRPASSAGLQKGPYGGSTRSLSNASDPYTIVRPASSNKELLPPPSSQLGSAHSYSRY